MEHPFINDLSNKTVEELQNDISKLNKSLNYAYRCGNSQLIGQIQMALESYRTQQMKKMDALFEKQNLKNSIRVQSDSDSFVPFKDTKKD